MFTRELRPQKHSFFLLGPRATGKSTWLREAFPGVHRFDLLQNEIYFSLMGSPGRFREKVLALKKGSWVIVDEIQRIPSLLNEVHSLMEEYGYRFALTGSSARKLKRGQANLLAGRALMLQMFPLTQSEYRDGVGIEDVLKFGSLPAIVAEPEIRVERLEAYAGTYLKEEIKEEALTRNVESFSRFLEIAALANAQVTNLSNISRDAAVARATVTQYFNILEDTFLGTFLKAWTPRAKVKEVAHSKFYFFDCGVVRAIQGRLREELTPEERGLLLETYVFHELRARISYGKTGGELYYWRTPHQTEVDFIWTRGNRVVAIEVKAAKKWKAEFGKGIEALQNSKVKTSASYGVYLGSETLKTSWGTVLPIQEFLKRLSSGDVI